jgi:type I restriction enzyme S subunit
MEVMSGYKQTEVGAIPEEWDVDTLASVIPRNARYGIADGPFGSNLKTIHYRKAGIPIVTSGYVTEGRFYADNYLYVEKEKFEEEKRSAVRPGDIVMAKIGARCGASAILPAEHPIGILSGNALKITVDETRHSTFYIWQVLWNLYSEGNVEKLRTVGAQPAISMASLKKHKIALPPQSEQHAIAAVLSDVDALLDGLDRLIAKKCDIKKAVMQQLLPGETRLFGFDGEWEVKTLGDLFTFSGGYSASRDQLSSQGYCYLHYGDIHGSSKTSIDTQTDYLDIPKLNISLKQVSPNSLLKDGDVVFVDASEDDEGTSKHVVVVNKDNVPFISGLHTIVAKSKTDELTLEYRHYCFQTAAFRQQFLFYAVGTKVSGISKSNIPKLTIPFPSTQEEQLAIAKALSDMDAELSALEARRDKTRALKQAMMQELLTGKTRLIPIGAAYG